MNSRRLWAGLLALAAGLTALGSLFVPWWSAIAAGNDSFAFYLGDSLQAFESSTVETVTLSYGTVGMVWIETLYTALLVVVLVSLILALIAGILALLAALGKIRSSYWTRAVRTFLVVALAMGLAAMLALPVGQTTAFSREKSSELNFCTVNPGGQNPCNSFWGSANNSGTIVRWAPSVGWYLSVASLALLVLGLLFWWWGRPRPPRAARTAPSVSVPSDVPAAVVGASPAPPTP